MRLICFNFLVLIASNVLGQSKYPPLSGNGSVPSKFFCNHKNLWKYNDLACNGRFDIYSDSLHGNLLDRSLYFTSGQLDSVIVFAIGYIPSDFSKKYILSERKFVANSNVVEYKMWSAAGQYIARYQFLIINNYEMNSIGRVLTLTEDTRCIEDGYHEDYSNGQVSIVGTYMRGDKVGTWKYYSWNGALIRQEEWRANQLVSVVVNYTK